MLLQELLDRDKITMDVLGPYPFTETNQNLFGRQDIERQRFVAVFRMHGEEGILLVPSFTQGDVTPPEPAIVFGCVLSDATSADQATDWRDFASSFGYDPDSITARETYEACLKERDQLREFLGALFDEYMSNEYDD